MDGWLNWPRLIIFRLGSKPKWLQILQNLLENTQNHPPKKKQKTPTTLNFLKTDLCRKTLSSKVDLVWQLWPIRKVENARTLILFLSSFLKKTKKTGLSRPKHSLLPQDFDLDPSFSMKKSVFIWSLIWFISRRTYSLVRRVRHNSKIESKSDLLNTKHWKIRCFWIMVKIILKKTYIFLIVEIVFLQKVWKKEDQCTSIFHFADRPELPYEDDFWRNRFPTKIGFQKIWRLLSFWDFWEGGFGCFRKDFDGFVIILARKNDEKCSQGVN